MVENGAGYTESDHRPEGPPLSQALGKVSVLLGLDKEGREALASHFMPDRPEVSEERRQQVCTQVALLMKDYFAAHDVLLRVGAWNEHQFKRQQALKNQRSVVRSLLGSRVDARPPVRLDDLVRQRPHLRETLIGLTTDAFTGALANYASRRKIDLSKLIGGVGIEPLLAPAQPAPHDEEAVIAEVTTPEPVEEPEENDEVADAWVTLDATIPGSSDFTVSPPPEARLRWAGIAKMSEAMGRLEEEVNDPDWSTNHTLGLARDFQNPAVAFLSRIEHPLLSDQDIRLLYGRMHAGREALRALGSADGQNIQELERLAVLGYRARTILIEHNLRLVRKIARSYSHWEMDEVIQGGNVGLVAAMDRYRLLYREVSEGKPEPEEYTEDDRVNISTLATWYVVGDIFRTIQKESRATFVRTWPGSDVIGGATEWERELLFRVHEEAAKLGYPNTFKEVGRWLGFSEKKVDSLVAHRTTSRIVRIDESIDDPESPIHLPLTKAITDLAPAESFGAVDGEVSREAFWREIKKRLPPRHYQVIVMRYVYGMAQQEIANRAGVTRQRIQEIQKVALDKLSISFGVVAEEPDKLKRPKRHGWDGPSIMLAKLGVEMPESDREAKRARIIELLGRASLTAQQRVAVSMRYGLDDPEGSLKTLEAVGSVVGLTAPQVRWLEGRAIMGIRKLLGNRG